MPSFLRPGLSDPVSKLRALEPAPKFVAFLALTFVLSPQLAIATVGGNLLLGPLGVVVALFFYAWFAGWLLLSPGRQANVTAPCARCGASLTGVALRCSACGLPSPA